MWILGIRHNVQPSELCALANGTAKHITPLLLVLVHNVHIQASNRGIIAYYPTKCCRAIGVMNLHIWCMIADASASAIRLMLMCLATRLLEIHLFVS